MLKIIKFIRYVIYIIYLQLKGIKYEFIKKFKGYEESSKYVQKVGYLWSKFTINIIGIDIELVGKENIPNEPCIFIGNHSSILDIPLILYTSNKKVGFIAKKEMLDVPIIGYWLKRSGSIALNRENPREAIKSINECVKNIKNGYSIGLFPEGTRSKNGSIGEFKKGSFKFATKSKCPIVPVSIDRASRCFEDNRDFVANKIKIVYDKPIYTADLSHDDEKKLAEKVRNIVVSNLQ